MFRIVNFFEYIMKKTAVLTLPFILAACTSTSDVQVSSDTYQETYQDGQTVSTSGTKPSETFNETDVTTSNTSAKSSASTETNQTSAEAKSSTQAQETASSVNTQSASTTSSQTQSSSSSSNSSIEAGSYTLQLVAGQSAEAVTKTASKLSGETSKWQYTKAINGITIYSLFYGQYATAEAARAAIQTLPSSVQTLKPFPVNMSGVEKTQLHEL